jgi:hypothetical protein
MEAFTNHYVPVVRREPEYMLADMWTSSLADFYVANTMSSCEGIVAQWRIFHGKPHTVYPRSCFDGFSEKPDEEEPMCGPQAKWDDYL